MLGESRDTLADDIRQHDGHEQPGKADCAKPDGAEACFRAIAPFDTCLRRIRIIIDGLASGPVLRPLVSHTVPDTSGRWPARSH